MNAYVLDWLNLLVRWFHFVAGIVDRRIVLLHLARQQPDAAAKAPRFDARRRRANSGPVHGGGFYHNQKYLTGPKDEPLTHDLHWFKWEAYSTWLSGIAMLAIVYWCARRARIMIDRSVLAITPARRSRSVAALAGRRLARLRRRFAGCSSSRSRCCWGFWSSPCWSLPRGVLRTSSAAARRTSTSARLSARSWSRTSSS